MSHSKLSDMTPIVDLTHNVATGPRRTSHPVYVDLLPPCNSACPAGEDIQAWMDAAQGGDFKKAWEILVRDNPMPSVHGRVCYHPCETHCNRESLDSAVGIHAVERFLGDRAIEGGWKLPVDAPSSGKRVLIVGAGPSGLSAAYHLARRGHSVEIHDAGPLPGGMLHFGIPAYRLPREVLMREIAAIQEMGVTIVLNHRVDDVLAEKKSGNFDAVFIAIGAHLSRHTDIPARDAVKILDAVPFLRAVESADAPQLGRRVIVYGGGNTAMDAARTAKRLGATETLVIYRSNSAHMSAHAFESQEALSEGIQIKWLSSITAINGANLIVEQMQIGADGRPEGTGRFETLHADAVVLALGQNADSGFLRKIPSIIFRDDGTIDIGNDMMSGEPGIFAGGDLVPGERTVTVATGHGKKAARYIHAWLAAQPTVPTVKHPPVSLSMLHLPIYSDADPAQQRELAQAQREHSFEEVVAGLSQAEALHEARRCLSCGNCFECDNCLAACPETAVLKLGPGNRYRFDYDRCTGCAACFDQCPSHAIEMMPDLPAGAVQ
jgi:formate dehydrogenase beta subunit